MSSLFKYPGQPAPVKIGMINARVRPEKLVKRENGKKRRARERVLLATEAISVARRLEEREGEKEGEGKREGEREGREEDLPPPASSCDGSNFRRWEEREDAHGRKNRFLPAVPSRRK